MCDRLSGVAARVPRTVPGSYTAEHTRSRPTGHPSPTPRLCPHTHTQTALWYPYDAHGLPPAVPARKHIHTHTHTPLRSHAYAAAAAAAAARCCYCYCRANGGIAALCYRHCPGRRCSCWWGDCSSTDVLAPPPPPPPPPRPASLCHSSSSPLRAGDSPRAIAATAARPRAAAAAA